VGDPEKLRRIVWNLLDNAVKFTDKGRVVFHAGARPLGENSYRVRFEVHDTGIGIDSKDWPGLFQPFRLADASSTRRFCGAGMGLAIVRKLVDLMNGQVSVESTPAGSRFTVELTLEALPVSHPSDARAVPGAQDSAVQDSTLTAA
jgi:signal transduction histidine kinase